MDQTARIYSRHLTERAGLHVVLNTRERSRSVAELRVVEDVVAFEPQLQILPFMSRAEIDVLLHCHVPVVEARAMEAVARHAEQCRTAKSGESRGKRGGTIEQDVLDDFPEAFV